LILHKSKGQLALVIAEFIFELIKVIFCVWFLASILKILVALSPMFANILLWPFRY
jgi:hypothetical protein